MNEPSIEELRELMNSTKKAEESIGEAVDRLWDLFSPSDQKRITDSIVRAKRKALLPSRA